MRIAVLSDIHANRLALEAVLQDSLNCEVERYWFLGDAVGYGPEPIAPVLFLKRYVNEGDWVLGNHDAMLADLLLPEDLQTLPNDFQPLAMTARENMPVICRGRFLSEEDWQATGAAPIQALKLNRAVLSQNAEADLFWRAEFAPAQAQPHVRSVDGIDYVLVHSGQVSHLFRYIYAWQVDFFLPAEFSRLQTVVEAQGCSRVQWFGHTHVPTLVFAHPKQTQTGFEFQPMRLLPGETYPLDGPLALVNPGSVGQPRDLDRRAAYAVLDTLQRTVTFRRVSYDWQATAEALIAGGYPDSLIRRIRDASPTKETPGDWLAHYEQAKEIAL
jgi:predicted phosphodiesterase